MLKIITVIGARPQIIKAAAISRAIKNNYPAKIQELIVHTGQHYDNNMSNVFFEELGIPLPDYNLNVGSARHGIQTARMIEGIEELLIKEKPDYIVLYGDTNSTLAGAVAASKLNIPIVHIEAGLRSYNRKMPEEINRVTCDHLSTLLFSPTKTGYENLKREGFNQNATSHYNPDNPGIFHCGDIMYDNSLYFSDLAESRSKIIEQNNLVKDKYVLSTVHRDHNTDVKENLENIFNALIKISGTIKVVLPLHPRTKNVLKADKHKALYEKIKSNDNIILLAPVSFLDMISLEKNAALVITDSGGVQKEAYFFNNPCIILRPETEWVEIVETGNAILCGADYDKIIEAFNHFENQDKMKFPKIFGDGKASEFILKTMIDNFIIQGNNSHKFT